MPADLHYLTIAEAAQGLRRREYSPVDLAQACLERIAAVDGRLHSFITVTQDLALRQAREAEKELLFGEDRGVLHGIPIALKDLYMTSQIRTTCHSRLRESWIPDSDATAVRRLRTAGAVLLGKLGMHEFAFGGPALDAPFPPVRNPWDVNHIPGGSSSGSGAAVAAGLCFAALGSDTGGSIRGPASHCGIVGVKPTYGRVSRFGLVPLSWSLDHAGPMARTVEDCALVLQAIAGYDPNDAASADAAVPDYRNALSENLRGVRIGVPRAGWFDELEGVHEETRVLFDAALKVCADLGAVLVELDGRPFAQARKANQTILVCEAYAYHEKDLQATPHLYGAAVRRRILEGAFLGAADYIQALRARSFLNQKIRANVDSVDAIATPTMPRPPEAFAALDPDEANRRPNFTNPFNLSGLPAISVPCGFTPQGLPVGMQIAAAPFAEGTALRVARCYEQASPWYRRRPNL